MPYECPICERNFSVRSDYNSHYKRCKFDNENKYNSIQEGYSVYNNARTINNLINKIEKLETIITKLQKCNRPRMRNVNIQEYINENVKRNEEYNDWKCKIEITYKRLKMILTEGFSSGLAKILKEELDGEVPMLSFTKKKMIYIYENNEWIEYDNKKLESLLYLLMAKINECWTNHEKLICGCEYKDINFYSRHNSAAAIYLKHRHILYGDGKVDKHAEKIYDILYNFLKTNVNSILVTENYI